MSLVNMNGFDVVSDSDNDRFCRREEGKGVKYTQ